MSAIKRRGRCEKEKKRRAWETERKQGRAESQPREVRFAKAGYMRLEAQGLNLPAIKKAADQAMQWS